jgi:cysteinyl-tRNA synthetase
VGREALEDSARAFRTFDEVLGILQPAAERADLVDPLLDLIVALREDARKRKDFVAADRIREALAAVGVVLEDTRDGVRWKRK